MARPKKKNFITEYTVVLKDGTKLVVCGENLTPGYSSTDPISITCGFRVVFYATDVSYVTSTDIELDAKVSQ